MSFRSSASGESGRLALGGSLTIENAARIREELIRAFRESDRVVIELMKDAVADISFIQILSAAKKTASLQQKSFEVDWSDAQGVRRSIENAGFNPDELSFPGAGNDRRSE